MADEYSEVGDCTCAAWYPNECCCGADWTDEEVYKLRSELKEAHELINNVRKILASTVPEHGVKESLIQLRLYKKEKGI